MFLQRSAPGVWSRPPNPRRTTPGRFADMHIPNYLSPLVLSRPRVHDVVRPHPSLPGRPKVPCDPASTPVDASGGSRVRTATILQHAMKLPTRRRWKGADVNLDDEAERKGQHVGGLSKDWEERTQRGNCWWGDVWSYKCSNPSFALAWGRACRNLVLMLQGDCLLLRGVASPTR